MMALDPEDYDVLQDRHREVFSALLGRTALELEEEQPLFEVFQCVERLVQCRSNYDWLLRFAQSPIEKIAAAILSTATDGHRSIYVPCPKPPYENPLTMVVAQPKLTIDGQIFRPDFLCQCRSLDDVDRYVIIECDGHDFHEKTKQQAAKDRSRDRIMIGAGFIVLRFTGSELYKTPYDCAIQIYKVFDNCVTPNSNMPIAKNFEVELIKQDKKPA